MTCPYKAKQRVRCISIERADSLEIDDPFECSGAGYNEGFEFTIQRISKVTRNNPPRYILWGAWNTNGVYAEYVELINDAELLNNDYYS